MAQPSDLPTIKNSKEIASISNPGFVSMQSDCIFIFKTEADVADT